MIKKEYKYINKHILLKYFLAKEHFIYMEMKVNQRIINHFKCIDKLEHTKSNQKKIDELEKEMEKNSEQLQEIKVCIENVEKELASSKYQVVGL